MPVTRGALRAAKVLAIPRNETYATVEPSATGQGTHTRWHYPGGDNGEVEIAVDHPLFSLSPLSSIFSESEVGSDPEPDVEPGFATPPPRGPSAAGSVLKTPAKKLQRDPERVGFTTIPFRRNDLCGIEEGEVSQPDGNPTSRLLVPLAARRQELEMFRDQVDFLLNDKRAADIYLEESIAKNHIAQPDSEGILMPPISSRPGRNGRMLGPHGTHLLGPHGTHLFDSQMDADEMDTENPRRLRRTRPLREEPTVVAETVLTFVENRPVVTAPTVRKGARLGPHGTEIVEVEDYVPVERVNTRYFSGQPGVSTPMSIGVDGRKGRTR